MNTPVSESAGYLGFGINPFSASCSRFLYIYSYWGGGTLKMRDWKMRDWNYRHHITRVENAGLKNSGTGNVWKVTVWHNLVYLALL